MDRKGIQVYTRYVEGYPIKSFKATTTINGKPDDIARFIMQIEDFENWVANCESTEILKKEGTDLVFFHMLIDTPFPVTSRDLVQSARLKRIDQGNLEIVITNHPGMIAQKEGIVRMPSSDGGWKIRSIDDSTCLVELEMLNDPGGTIPDWIVNSMLTGSPFKTMSNLREHFSE